MQINSSFPDLLGLRETPTHHLTLEYNDVTQNILWETPLLDFLSGRTFFLNIPFGDLGDILIWKSIDYRMKFYVSSLFPIKNYTLFKITTIKYTGYLNGQNRQYPHL